MMYLLVPNRPHSLKFMPMPRTLLPHLLLHWVNSLLLRNLLGSVQKSPPLESPAASSPIVFAYVPLTRTEGQAKSGVPGWGLVRNTGLLNKGDGRCERGRGRAREPHSGACTLSFPEDEWGGAALSRSFSMPPSTQSTLRNSFPTRNKTVLL